MTAAAQARALAIMRVERALAELAHALDALERVTGGGRDD